MATKFVIINASILLAYFAHLFHQIFCSSSAIVEIKNNYVSNIIQFYYHSMVNIILTHYMNQRWFTYLNLLVTFILLSGSTSLQQLQYFNYCDCDPMLLFKFKWSAE